VSFAGNRRAYGAMQKAMREQELLETLAQIERLSREADRERVDVASMLGDIARAAIAKAANP
jgi:hypothetical protein